MKRDKFYSVFRCTIDTNNNIAQAAWILIMLLTTSVAFADGVLCQSRALVGSYPVQSAGIVTQEGSITCISSYAASFQVIDTSNPSSPSLQSTVWLYSGVENQIHDMELIGTILFITQTVELGFEFFYMYDLSDPTNPVQLSVTHYQSGIGEFAIQGNILYLKTYNSIEIIGISDPTSPQAIGSINTIGGAHIDIQGNYLFTEDSSSGSTDIAIFDITTPTSPQLLGTLPYEGYIRSIKANESNIFVAIGSTLLNIEYSDPTQPTLANQTHFKNAIYDLTLQHDSIVLMQGNHGISIVDISNPADPNLLGGFDTPGTANHCELVNNISYIADQHGGLQILDIQSPLTSTPELGEYDPDGAIIKGVVVRDNLAYLVDIREGLIILDVTDPTSSIVQGQLPISSNPYRVQLFESVAYVVTTGSVVSVDISDPSNPTELGKFEFSFSGNPVVIETNQTTVFAKSYFDTQVRVIDFSDPTSPVELNIGIDMQPVIGVSVDQDRLYLLTDNSELRVYDYSIRNAPTLLGEYSDGTVSLRNVIARNGIAYVPTYINASQEVTRIIDMTTPSTPELVSTIPTVDRVRAFKVIEDQLYQTVHYYGLEIYNVSQPEYPTRVGYNFWGTDDFDFNQSTGYFAADYVAGLQILDMSDCPPPCPADLNDDQTYDFFDVSAFLTAFATLDPAADFNNDGSFDFFDVSAFLTAFAQGCP